MLDRLKALARSLLLRRRLDEDMEDEMRFHLEQEIETNLRRGMSAAGVCYLPLPQLQFLPAPPRPGSSVGRAED